MRCRRTAVVAGLTAVILVASGCGTADPDPGEGGRETAGRPSVTAPIATPAVAGMQAVAVRLRTDTAIGGQFQTRITNTGSEPFTVQAVSLDSPAFERLPFAGRPALYRPGAIIDLPTLYGPSLCGNGIEVDPAFTQLRVQRPDGLMEEVNIPLEAPDDIIDRIHHEECHKLALAAAVGVSLGDFSTGEVGGRTVVQATITLTRRDSTEEIAIFELRGSVVFDVVATNDGQQQTMPAGEDQLVVPILVQHTARGCDGHVLGETKQPFLFPFFLTFNGGEPQYGVLDVSAEQRSALWAYIQAVCPHG